MSRRDNNWAVMTRRETRSQDENKETQFARRRIIADLGIARHAKVMNHVLIESIQPAPWRQLITYTSVSRRSLV